MIVVPYFDLWFFFLWLMCPASIGILSLNLFPFVFALRVCFPLERMMLLVFLRKSVNWMMGSIYAGYITETKELERDAGETSDPPRS